MMTTEKKCNEKTTLQEELQGFLNLLPIFFRNGFLLRDSKR